MEDKYSSYFQRWPCREGPAPGAGEWQARCPPLSELTEGLMFWGREDNSGNYGIGFHGNCACGVGSYTGSSYPARYRQANKRAIFFADYAAQWINVLWVDANDELLPAESIEQFDSGLGILNNVRFSCILGLIDRIGFDPNGNLFVLTIIGGFFRYLPAVDQSSFFLPPAPMISANVTTGNLAQGIHFSLLLNKLGPFKVQFSSDGTYDPLNLQMVFFWNFGDGTSSTLANPIHTFSTPGPFTVTLNVTNTFLLSAVETLVIKVKHNFPHLTS
jgi:hypothetical protein